MRQKLKDNSEEAEGPPVEGKVPQLLREDDQRVDAEAAAAVKVADTPTAEAQQREENKTAARAYLAELGLTGLHTE